MSQSGWNSQLSWGALICPASSCPPQSPRPAFPHRSQWCRSGRAGASAWGTWSPGRRCRQSGVPPSPILHSYFFFYPFYGLLVYLSHITQLFFKLVCLLVFLLHPLVSEWVSLLNAYFYPDGSNFPWSPPLQPFFLKLILFALLCS